MTDRLAKDWVIKAANQRKTPEQVAVIAAQKKAIGEGMNDRGRESVDRVLVAIGARNLENDKVYVEEEHKETEHRSPDDLRGIDLKIMVRVVDIHEPIAVLIEIKSSDAGVGKFLDDQKLWDRAITLDDLTRHQRMVLNGQWKTEDIQKEFLYQLQAIIKALGNTIKIVSEPVEGKRPIANALAGKR